MSGPEPATAGTVRNPAAPAVAAILSLVAIALVGAICLQIARAHRVTTLRVLGAPSFLLDADGRRRLRELGLAIDPVARSGSRVLDEADYGQYAAIFASGTTIAEAVEQRLRTRTPRLDYRRSTPIASPVTLLSWPPVAQRLRDAGMASKHDGYWTFDLVAFAAATASQAPSAPANQTAAATAGRTASTPTNRAEAAVREIGLSTTRPRDSDAAVALVSLLAMTLDRDATPQVDLDRPATKAMVATVASVFRAQNAPYATPGRLTADYRHGIGTMPLGLGCEHEWVTAALPTGGMARTAADGTAAGGMTAMYVAPAAVVPTTVFSTGTEGQRLLRAIDTDPQLRRLITRAGYRSVPAERVDWDERLLITGLRERGISVPTAAALLAGAARVPELPSGALSALLGRIDQLNGYT